MAEKKLQVMISSTVRDLEEYRAEAKDACLKCGMFPDLMENRPAQDTEAITASKAMVDKADIYIGIFAHRYGYTPKEDNPSKISITEMEYDRAVELGIPRLIFLIKENHPFDPSYVDRGKDASKLAKLRKRLATERVVLFFTSPEDLRGHIVSSLAELKRSVSPETTPKQSGGVVIRDIPPPPEKYIAHPYLLLQTPELIGRRKELDLLNQWVSEPELDIYDRNIFSFVAIGGLGKSALTWQWFNKIAPEKMKDLAGRMWWSFYDPNADFENFVLHALSYVANIPVEDIRDKVSPPERETRLLAALNQKPYLIVFDGFERVLNAYSGADAALLEDSEVDIHGKARKTADPRVGQFLKKLAQVKNSRILISTRLQPAELENEVDDPLPGVYKYDLKSLPDTDAIDLWRRLGVEGARDILLHLFRQFDKHTLLIQVLAGEVRRFRPAPGDLEKWLAANPRFDPAKYSKTKDRTAHVLEFPLSGLGKDEQEVLNTIVAFRNPPSYATLASILIGDGRPCSDKDRLDEALTDLEDRGLMGWNRPADRYEIHPVVRSVVWGGLGVDAKQDIYANLHSHFEAMPMIDDYLKVNSLEDLTPAIELYNTLIGMGRYEDAGDLFYDRLEYATHFRLSASRQRVEMLEMLFPDGLDELPRLSKQGDQAFVLNALALGFKIGGQSGRAAPLYRRVNSILSESGDDANLESGLENLSNVLRVTGGLRESEETARRALAIAREQNRRFDERTSLYYLGLALAARGEAEESGTVLRRSLRIVIAEKHIQGEGLTNASLAQRAILFGLYADGLEFADQAWKFADVDKLGRDFTRAARMQGEAALGLDDFDTAGERLHYSLIRSRAVNFVEEEIQTLTALAELRRRQGDEKAAREFLEDVWEFAERGPYPLFHADALNVLVQIERDAGNTEKAVEAATKAYQLAWCDGPPYAYHWGLEKAQKHLEELGEPLPDMPPFDESKFEPMPEVEIDPDDEFHVGEESS
jgi:tetratricopeptide (TPR) repeat protein